MHVIKFLSSAEEKEKESPFCTIDNWILLFIFLSSSHFHSSISLVTSNSRASTYTLFNLIIFWFSICNWTRGMSKLLLLLLLQQKKEKKKTNKINSKFFYHSILFIWFVFCYCYLLNFICIFVVVHFLLGFHQWHRAFRMVFQPWKCFRSKHLMDIGRILPLLLILTATLLIRTTAVKRNVLHSRNYITKVYKYLFTLTDTYIHTHTHKPISNESFFLHCFCFWHSHDVNNNKKVGFLFWIGRASHKRQAWKDKVNES